LRCERAKQKGPYDREALIGYNFFFKLIFNDENHSKFSNFCRFENYEMTNMHIASSRAFYPYQKCNKEPHGARGLTVQEGQTVVTKQNKHLNFI
jgi:hypothetical protein